MPRLAPQCQLGPQPLPARLARSCSCAPRARRSALPTPCSRMSWVLRRSAPPRRARLVTARLSALALSPLGQTARLDSAPELAHRPRPRSVPAPWSQHQRPTPLGPSSRLALWSPRQGPTPLGLSSQLAPWSQRQGPAPLGPSSRLAPPGLRPRPARTRAQRRAHVQRAPGWLQRLWVSARGQRTRSGAPAYSAHWVHCSASGSAPGASASATACPGAVRIGSAAMPLGPHPRPARVQRYACLCAPDRLDAPGHRPRPSYA